MFLLLISLQGPLALHPLPAPPPREAGVLHLSTGAWTRKAHTASLGADVIYDNTCDSGYFSAFSGFVYTDDGRLPSPTSPDSSISKPGCATQYAIDGVTIRYCTDQPNPGAWTLSFHESAMPCAPVQTLPPTASIVADGLPGSASGAVACWTVTIDLGAAASFTLRADGNGSYAGTNNQNTFEWVMRSSLPAASQAATGPYIAGTPGVCERWDGTRWDPVVNDAESGTGMGNQDLIRVEDPGGGGYGCAYFGGNPFAGFFLELRAQACDAPVGATFCAGDGSGTACPCGNASAAGLEVGCLNSIGSGARLRASGDASYTNDGDGASSLWLSVDSMPASTSCLFFQGTTRANGGAGTTFGDGLRCAGGSVLRLGSKIASGGAASYPASGDPAIAIQGMIAAGGTRTYQVWYRNSASFCTPSGFNLTNGVELQWSL